MNNRRHASWGHWNITFWERPASQAAWDTYHPGEERGRISFPIGNCGPCDLENRAAYREAVRAWVDDGILPGAHQ